jgi:murein L,D-transpeptidase YafK
VPRSGLEDVWDLNYLDMSRRAGLVAVFAVALMGAAVPPPSSTAKATRVLVKKSARTMTLYAGDDVVATYSVAVGKGGAGYKRMEGDLVTPVGHYHVIKHEPSYLRIFLRLDYPNAEDRARFDDLKKRGELPKNATIGGEIGIHGEPPEPKPFHKAEYLSHGCVVLEDAEIDQVARAVADGTPVDIED